ncbi:hypothetical protein RM528_34835, partial [Streptomyces sp. DSM 41635]|nr:hypothetical protein [Streptomyces sp. DSM 41635]
MQATITVTAATHASAGCSSPRRSSAFFVLELVTALAINSIALLADAGHMLTDLVAMFMGLTAVLLA